ncbi:MAG: PQQ-binding-like beta-propeller repeat protein [Verrucomicrobia bacterium]|nr:PQQ-binding-like beta-propeller repeat protein [Verrucomicrobiota bacterium]MDA1066657.1 PQQ-binding-like beta-propeller repeat protein [Verrucomicrobiota bacterium]
MKHLLFFIFPLVILIFWGCGNAQQTSENNWPQFRGYQANGLDLRKPTPTEWNVESGQNVLWQTPVSGLAHSAPIIWGERIYVTTAVGPGEAELKIGLYGDIAAAEDQGLHQWRLLAIDRKTGQVIFDKLGHEGIPRSVRHTKGTHCNSTPATDGEHIVAYLGSEGLFCFDMDGDLVWKKDLGSMDAGYFKVKTAQWGFASSPVIHDGKVVVQCDVQEGAFLAVFDLESGEEVWRTPRSDVPTWSTPTVVEVQGRMQILVNGWHHTGAYDFESGDEIWKLDGGGDIPVPTPILGDGMAYFTSAHGVFRPMRGIQLTAKGDITPPTIEDTNEAISWVHHRRGNYMQTPILIGDHLYGCDDRGALTCFNPIDGEILFSERLKDNGFTASPVSDGNHIYVTSEFGKVWVLKVGDAYDEISINDLGDNCLATPAIAQGTLYFRTQHSLLAIGE